MSISMSRAEGTTVFTVTSDTRSSWPPLCQILKALCYSPACCTVSERLRRLQGSSQTSLGTLQIILGLLNIGLGIILFVTSGIYTAANDTLCPVWLGVLFMVFGTVCVLSEKYPSRCLVILNVMANLAGVAFATTGVVLYSISIANPYFWRGCGSWYYYGRTTTPSPDSRVNDIQEQCEWFQSQALLLVRGIIGILIVLSTLQLCVNISASVLGVKALRRCKNKAPEDPEQFKPLMEDEQRE